MKLFKRPKFLTKNIILLSIISFFTDIASEMLYPVMPLYLSNIGYGLVGIALLEGLADIVAGLSKGIFGIISDRINNRNLFVKIGYGLSTVAKPIMGIVPIFQVIFVSRLLDRFGKGIRTAPRDAILTSESSPSNRGLVFGFHRSMDSFGAMIGPLLSLVFLFFYPSQYSLLFSIAIIPGSIALFLTFKLNKTGSQADPKITENKIQKAVRLNNEISIDSKKETDIKSKKVSWNPIVFFQESSAGYRKLIIGFLLLGLINSSDMFILLRIKEMGMTELWIIGLYIFYNLIFALSSIPLGIMADKFGFKKVYLIGLIVFAGVYGSLAYNMSLFNLVLIFIAYGAFSAINEGITKAWLSLQLESHNQATGIGVFLALSSFSFLFSSLLTGIVWERFGSSAAFTMLSLLSVLVIGYFWLVKTPHQDQVDSKITLSCNPGH